MNVIVYAIASRSGGALSVLSDFYKEVTENADKYLDITWYFMLSTQEFSETSNVKILRADWSVKSWFHRAYYNLVTVKKIIKRYDIKAIISLQNMCVMGTNIPNIVCLHNVLPLYKCDANVLDNAKQRVKQLLVNRGIVKSIKSAYRVMVASEWIKEELIEKFGVDEKHIVVSKLMIPEMGEKISDTSNRSIAPDTENKTTFFYPAGPLPYKNHKVIIEACKKLKEEKIDNYKVEFTIDEKQGKTAAGLYDEVVRHDLPVSFVGNLSRDLVLQSYANKVLVFPSKIENDAMPLIECIQYCGYALAADLPYSRDVLDLYPGKQYFMQDDADALAKEMKELIIHGIPQVKAVKSTGAHNEITRPEKVALILRELEMECDM